VPVLLDKEMRARLLLTHQKIFPLMEEIELEFLVAFSAEYHRKQ
jgi:hypothetical protein